ncbi:MAG: hypothetical protein LUO98_06435 [Methanoregula sp.]|nr:hypothetical protein [Methanoregula sp.]
MKFFDPNQEKNPAGFFELSKVIRPERGEEQSSSTRTRRRTLQGSSSC